MKITQIFKSHFMNTKLDIYILRLKDSSWWDASVVKGAWHWNLGLGPGTHAELGQREPEQALQAASDLYKYALTIQTVLKEKTQTC